MEKQIEQARQCVAEREADLQDAETTKKNFYEQLKDMEEGQENRASQAQAQVKATPDQVVDAVGQL
eukprot:11072377-Alexandrium_andersonii.AAC.1